MQNERRNGAELLPRATSVQVGIQNIGPKFFNGGQPDLVVAGPNVGSNTGLINLLSGTVYVLYLNLNLRTKVLT